ncbi:MAG: fimbrillin family protein [Muribaculaceae bacterium]|nr:fimbrillin family protein [Muribaculaceae bacterium]
MKTIANTSYIIFGGLMALSSCGQEESSVIIPDRDDRRIAFHASLPELTTKAAEITKDPQYFRMTAFNESDDRFVDGVTIKEYFNNSLLEKDKEFKSDECIWPDPGQESDRLHFFAYYPAMNSGAGLVNTSVVSDGNKTIGYRMTGFQVAPDIADQVDFVTAYTTGSMADNYFSGIELGFRHQLSRIEVKARGEHKSCDIEIAGVCLANVPMSGNFEFQKSDSDGIWSDIVQGNAGYIFREGDAIVTVGKDPVSIMGSKIEGGDDNCAMLIPTTCPAWNYTGNARNSDKGMYLNVLLRIIDKTPTTGKGKVQYPYFDNSQGLNAMNIERVYMAVNKTNGTVSKRVYKKDNTYFSDKACTQSYTVASGDEIREFGWAALPVSADWQPGYSYCYTIDYTSGVGVHGPDVIGDVSPKAGDPVISDRIGVTVSVNGWQGLNGSTTHTVDVPGA